MAVWLGSRLPLTTATAVWFDGICERRNTSLKQMAKEVGCDHSYLSRIRTGGRLPSRVWYERFVVKCQLTKEEAIRGYELFRYIPPGYRVVPMRDAA